jgi:hypothetical protein
MVSWDAIYSWEEAVNFAEITANNLESQISKEVARLRELIPILKELYCL